MFSCEFCEILKNIFFKEDLRATTPVSCLFVSLDDCIRIRMHNLLPCKQILNQLPKLASLVIWLCVCLWAKRLWQRLSSINKSSVKKWLSFSWNFAKFFSIAFSQDASVDCFCTEKWFRKKNFENFTRKRKSELKTKLRPVGFPFIHSCAQSTSWQLYS